MAVPEDGFCGLSSVETEPLERHPIRLRGSGYTEAAWRLRVRCAEGQGAIVLVEVSPGESVFRGEGLFLGWDQDRLRSVYEAAASQGAPGDPPVEIPQLG
jgi:hypothetical protein